MTDVGHLTAVMADDHEIVRAGLARTVEKTCLAAAGGFDVVGEAGDGFEIRVAVK